MWWLLCKLSIPTLSPLLSLSLVRCRKKLLSPQAEPRNFSFLLSSSLVLYCTLLPTLFLFLSLSWAKRDHLIFGHTDTHISKEREMNIENWTRKPISSNCFFSRKGEKKKALVNAPYVVLYTCRTLRADGRYTNTFVWQYASIRSNVSVLSPLHFH